MNYWGILNLDIINLILIKLDYSTFVTAKKLIDVNYCNLFRLKYGMSRLYDNLIAFKNLINWGKLYKDILKLGDRVTALKKFISCSKLIQWYDCRILNEGNPIITLPKDLLGELSWKTIDILSRIWIQIKLPHMYEKIKILPRLDGIIYLLYRTLKSGLSCATELAGYLRSGKVKDGTLIISHTLQADEPEITLFDCKYIPMILLLLSKEDNFDTFKWEYRLFNWNISNISIPISTNITISHIANEIGKTVNPDKIYIL